MLLYIILIQCITTWLLLHLGIIGICVYYERFWVYANVYIVIRFLFIFYNFSIVKIRVHHIILYETVYFFWNSHFFFLGKAAHHFDLYTDRKKNRIFYLYQTCDCSPAVNCFRRIQNLSALLCGLVYIVLLFKKHIIFYNNEIVVYTIFMYFKNIY